MKIVTESSLLPRHSKKKEGGLRAHRVDPNNGLREKEAEDMQIGDAKDRPLVTVITVVFNGIRGLEQTIQSVVGQTYNNIEYIIIDGGSTDGTIDVIKKYENKIHYWVSESDAGIYDAMNKGVRLSSGDYIGIIGAGDWYEEDAIASVIDAITRTNAKVVYGDVEIVDAETNYSYRRHSRCELMPKTMSSISHPSIFVARSIYLGRPFDTQFRIAADYDLFLGLYVGGYRFEHSGGMTVHVLTGGVSSSLRTQTEVFKIHRKYFGTFYAANQFVLTVLKRLFYETRRAVLLRLLSPSNFAALRAKWLRFKHR